MARCEYVFTYQDFQEAMKAYRKVFRKVAVGYWLYVWILPSAGIAVGLAWLLEFLKRDIDTFGPLSVAACVGLGIAWGLPVRYRISVRRAFDQRNALAKGNAMFCEFNESTIRFVVPGGTEISYPWDTFTHYSENGQVAVLFVQQAAFHTIPKRAMNEDVLIDLRRLVNQHIRKV